MHVCVDMHVCSLLMQTCTFISWARKYILVASVIVRKQFKEVSIYVASQFEIEFTMAAG